jgi:hypothetical protein
MFRSARDHHQGIKQSNRSKNQINHFSIQPTLCKRVHRHCVVEYLCYCPGSCTKWTMLCLRHKPNVWINTSALAAKTAIVCSPISCQVKVRNAHYLCVMVINSFIVTLFISLTAQECLWKPWRFKESVLVPELMCREHVFLRPVQKPELHYTVYVPSNGGILASRLHGVVMDSHCGALLPRPSSWGQLILYLSYVFSLNFVKFLPLYVCLIFKFKFVVF